MNMFEGKVIDGVLLPENEMFYRDMTPPRERVYLFMFPDGKPAHGWFYASNIHRTEVSQRILEIYNGTPQKLYG